MAIHPDTPAPPVDVAGEGELRATIKTSMGDITVRLFEDRAPRTVANFVALATGKVEWNDRGQKTSRPLYSGTIIHRVIPEFMIQMGCPLGTGTGSPGYRFGDEIHPSLKHDKPGILSMANAGPGTNGSQFFVCLDDVPLPPAYSVFGTVVEGMETLDAIAAVPTAGETPTEPVRLERVTVDL